MLVKLRLADNNPANALPQLRKKELSKVRPVSKDVVTRLLNVIDQSTWIEKRNYLIFSMLWSLGLRISELTTLTIGAFEPGHGHKTGLLRITGFKKSLKNYAINSFMYLCGLRVGEVFSLDLTSIDLKNRTIIVQGSVLLCEYLSSLKHFHHPLNIQSLSFPLKTLFLSLFSNIVHLS